MNSMYKKNISPGKTLTSRSKKFYEKYRFPGKRPIERDGMILLRYINRSIEELNTDRKKFHILDAGCGTGNTIISLAGIFKSIKFMGIDNSRASVLAALKSSQSKKLTNIKFRQWNLVHALPFKIKFNIICCLGVLHHTDDMKSVLRNLNNSLAEDGELYLWIYAKYGRYNHTLNLRFLRMLLETKPEIIDDISFTRELISGVKNNVIIKDLLKENINNTNLENTLLDRVWIADQFLNPVENLLDMKELTELAEDCGFQIRKVLGIDSQAENYFSSEILLDSFNKLNMKEQLIAMDLLLKPERHFVILKK